MVYICTGSLKNSLKNFITRNGMHRELVNYEFLDFCLVFACLIFLLATAAHQEGEFDAE